MIIQLQSGIGPSEKEAIILKIKSLEYKTTEVKTQQGMYLVAIGKKEFDIRQLGHMKGIADIHRAERILIWAMM
jgi:3-deoxy-7-phosphoheptulonate synthase